MTAAEILTQGAAASAFAKILVDLVKVSPLPSPSLLLPVLALVFSEAMAFLLFATGTEPFTRQAIAQTILVGVAATAGAIGTTALQNRSNDDKERET